MTNTAFEKFLLWEATSRDIIDFKKIYVDMVGDLNAGLMLSEVVYWYLPSKEDGSSRLRVMHDEVYWIACRRYEWWERTRLSPEKAERAIKLLIDVKLITKAIFKFAGSPTVHIRLMEDVFMARWSELINNPPVNPYLPAENSDLDKNPKTISGKTRKGKGEKPENDFGKTPKSLTESTGRDSSIDSYTSRGYAATPEPLVQVIDVWVKGWEGLVSGKPYGRKTYREDAQKLAQTTSLNDIKRYTLALRKKGSKWESARPSWGIWFNDLGAWLAKNPDLNPAPNDSDSEEKQESPEIQRALEKKLGG